MLKRDKAFVVCLSRRMLSQNVTVTRESQSSVHIDKRAPQCLPADRDWFHICLRVSKYLVGEGPRRVRDNSKGCWLTSPLITISPLCSLYWTRPIRGFALLNTKSRSRTWARHRHVELWHIVSPSLFDDFAKTAPMF